MTNDAYTVEHKIRRKRGKKKQKEKKALNITLRMLKPQFEYAGGGIGNL